MVNYGHIVKGQLKLLIDGLADMSILYMTNLFLKLNGKMKSHES